MFMATPCRLSRVLSSRSRYPVVHIVYWCDVENTLSLCSTTVASTGTEPEAEAIIAKVEKCANKLADATVMMMATTTTTTTADQDTIETLSWTCRFEELLRKISFFAK